VTALKEVDVGGRIAGSHMKSLSRSAVGSRHVSTALAYVGRKCMKFTIGSGHEQDVGVRCTLRVATRCRGAHDTGGQPWALEVLWGQNCLRREILKPRSAVWSC